MSTPAVDRARPGSPLGRALSIVTAGVICSLVAIVISIGNGSLVFATHLLSYRPASVGLALFATAVLGVVTSLTSSIRGGVPVAQEVPCVALGVVVGAVAAALPESVSTEAEYVTVMAAIGVATLIAGAGILLLGIFRLGGIIRFIPYSVIGGFLAGTGWLIALGGLGILLDAPATLDLFTAMPDAAALLRLVLAGVFVATLVYVRAAIASPLALPGVILLAVALFVAIAFGSGLSASELDAGGWLLSLPEGSRMWPAIGLSDLALVDWRAVALAMVSTPLLIIVSAIAFLLNATGVEMESGNDLDLNRELTAVGAMNMASGAGGGLPGFHAVSVTFLAMRLGAENRWVGMIAGAGAAVALILGDLVLTVIPTLVLGGMLLWIGGQLMVEWLILSYRRVEIWDYLTILLIFLIIVFVGFASGIVVGLIAAILLFVLKYGRVDIVRHQLTGADYQSSVEAPEQRRQLLQERGRAILVIKLQGFLFFGTSDRLRRRAQEQMREAAGDTAGFLLIDFERVTGIDASTVLSFIRLSQAARRHNFTIVLTGLSPSVLSALVRGDLKMGKGSPVRVEADAERGLKWCEDALLADLADDAQPQSLRLADMLTDVIGDAEAARTVAGYCQRVAVAAGERLIEQGAPSEDIFFIESGEAMVEMIGEGDAPVYLATVVAGAIVGEIAFYLDSQRSASVTATEPTVAWRLSAQAVEALQREAPDIALRFHRGMAATLSRRLTRTNRLVRFLAE